MAYDDEENEFGEYEDDESEPKREEMFVNKEMDVSGEELVRWLQWRDELGFIQHWQDLAMNAATGSSFIVTLN
jgi:hypothetical protein